MQSLMLSGPFSSLMQTSRSNTYSFESSFKVRIEALIAVLRSNEYRVFSAHEADQFGEHNWQEDFVDRDLSWVEQCDLLLVLLPRSTEGELIRSDGTMIELGYALALDKPVLFLCDGRTSERDSFFLRSILQSSRWFNISEIDEEGLIGAIQRQLPPAGSQKARARKHTTNVDAVLEELRTENEPHFVEVGGLNFKVYPQVLSPRLSHAPDALMERWSINGGDAVLDLGCGCGVLGISALAHGAGSLVALDINKVAVENTNENLKRLGFETQGEARLSDCYSALEQGECFDTVIFAAPYWSRKADDQLELSCFDEGHQFFARAVNDAHTWIRRGGRMYIIFSDQGDVSFASQVIADSHLTIKKLHLCRPTSEGGHIRIIWELANE